MFKKYQHVERIGSEEVSGILDGTVYIFPKLDGSNGSLWCEDHIIHCGSRNKELSLESDNQGFYAWVVSRLEFMRLFTDYPNLRLYGEWLVPHTLRTYEQSAWNKFYVFDVVDENGYIPYMEYKKLLDKYNIEYIPAIGTGINITEESLYKFLEKNTYLIKDGAGFGEGIVIKNYDFRNIYGRTIWGKIVRNSFKTSHNKSELKESKSKLSIEMKIAKELVTDSFLEKEIAKLENFSTKDIPKYFGIVYYEFIKDEMWDILKSYKNPTINFRILNKIIINMAKEFLSNKMLM